MSPELNIDPPKILAGFTRSLFWPGNRRHQKATMQRKKQKGRSALRALQARVAETDKKLELARRVARRAKLEYKRARKAFKEAKKTAKLARKMAKKAAARLGTERLSPKPARISKNNRARRRVALRVSKVTAPGSHATTVSPGEAPLRSATEL